MAQTPELWIEEADKPVWHHAILGLGSGRYVAGCGWRLSIRDGGIWPRQFVEPGPPRATRCHSCQLLSDG